jgi:hypothetical protein
MLRGGQLGGVCLQGDPYIALNNEELMSLRNAGYNALVAQKAIRAAKVGSQSNQCWPDQAAG